MLCFLPWLELEGIYYTREQVVLGRTCWINARDPVYFFGYGIPLKYVKRILFLPRALWAKHVGNVEARITTIRA